MELNVNFSDVQSKAAVPAGDYAGVIADCVVKEKQGSDHPYLNWDIQIAEGDHEGRHVYLTTSFKPEALWKMMETFQNLGLTDEEYNLKFDDATGQLLEPEVIGLPCTAQVFNEPYNNRMTSKVSSILGPNGEGAAEVVPPVAARPATKATAAVAAKNGPTTTGAAKRSPFPAASGAKRTFK